MTATAPFSFVQITDIHVGQKFVSTPDVLAEDLRQIEREVGDRVEFIVATGDLTDHGTEAECRMYVEALKATRFKIHPVVGNHDYINGPWAERRNDAAWYQKLIGPLNHSFDHHGVHFVSYDYLGPENSQRPSRWLLDDLGSLPTDTPVIFLVHHQLHASFYDQLKPWWIVASLSGHWHSSRLYHDGRIEHFNSPSLCFGGIDYTPRAYRVFTWTGSKLTCETMPFRRPPIRPASPQHCGELWRAPLNGEILLASPVLDSDRLFLGLMDENRTGNGAVVCWETPTGRELWRTRLDASVKNSVAVAETKVVAVTVTGEVVALDASNGRRLWTYQLGDPSQRWIFSSPCVQDGRVYAGQGPHFAALELDTGRAVWLRDDLTAWDWISSYVSPACDGARVIIGFQWQANSLQALDADTGQTAWKLEGDPGRPSPVSSPVLDGRGAFYITRHGGLGKFDAATGELHWTFPMQERWSPAAPCPDSDRLFVASGDGGVFAVNVETGEALWRWESCDDLEAMHPYRREGKTILSSPRLNGSHLLVGSNDGRLVALDNETGQLAWAHDFGAPVTSSPVIAHDRIFLAVRDGNLYALRPPEA